MNIWIFPWLNAESTLFISSDKTYWTYLSLDIWRTDHWALFGTALSQVECCPGHGVESALSKVECCPGHGVESALSQVECCPGHGVESGWLLPGTARSHNIFVSCLSYSHYRLHYLHNMVYDWSSYSILWSDFWRKKLGTRQVVPNCLRTSNPKCFFEILLINLVLKWAHTKLDLKFLEVAPDTKIVR